jgi:cytidine deaminase
VLAEFAPEARVYLVNHRGIAHATSVTALLPGGFDGSKLPS